MEVLGTKESFTLFEQPEKSCNGWTSLKLVLAKKRRGKAKRNWWLGWNGVRMAESADAKLLAEHHPEICGWIVDVLMKKDGKTYG